MVLVGRALDLTCAFEEEDTDGRFRFDSADLFPTERLVRLLDGRDEFAEEV